MCRITNEKNYQTSARGFSKFGYGSERSFVRLWRRVPPYLHEIKFDFEKELWTAADIDELGELLCQYELRFYLTALIWDTSQSTRSALYSKVMRDQSNSDRTVTLYICGKGKNRNR